jgi:hypothetical protein
VAAVFAGLPHPVAKGQRIVALLQEVFETNYSFDLDALPKKGTKPAARQVARYQASSDFVVAWVTLHCLDGHAVPIDMPALDAMKKLGLIDEEADNPAAVMAQLENQVPKSKAMAFIEHLNALAHEPAAKARRAKAEVPRAATRPKPR